VSFDADHQQPYTQGTGSAGNPRLLMIMGHLPIAVVTAVAVVEAYAWRLGFVWTAKDRKE
jgi:hypothetical protein